MNVLWHPDRALKAVANALVRLKQSEASDAAEVCFNQIEGGLTVAHKDLKQLATELEPTDTRFPIQVGTWSNLASLELLIRQFKQIISTCIDNDEPIVRVDLEAAGVTFRIRPYALESFVQLFACRLKEAYDVELLRTPRREGECPVYSVQLAENLFVIVTTWHG